MPRPFRSILTQNEFLKRGIADRHVQFGEQTVCSLQAPGYIGQQTVAGFASWLSIFHCFFSLTFTDTTGGPFGLESLNNSYSHSLLIRHNTPLRGQAKCLRNS